MLHTLSLNCRDFKEEKSTMEVLLDKLGSKGSLSIELLTTPKYHCELAGEGIEYSWGMGKYYYRNLPLEMKNLKSKFIKRARLSLTHISIERVWQFATKCRRYMLVYHKYNNQDLDNPKALTYKETERFVKKSKCHKNVSNQETAYLTRGRIHMQHKINDQCYIPLQLLQFFLWRFQTAPNMYMYKCWGVEWNVHCVVSSHDEGHGKYDKILLLVKIVSWMSRPLALVSRHVHWCCCIVDLNQPSLRQCERYVNTRSFKRTRRSNHFSNFL